MSDPITVRRSSGNVFADLGIEDPEEYLAKSELAAQNPGRHRGPGAHPEGRRRTAGDLAAQGVALLRGRLDGFSTDRLFRFLTRWEATSRSAYRGRTPKKPATSPCYRRRRSRRRRAHKGSGGMSVSGQAKVAVKRAKTKRKAGASTPVGATS